MHDTDDLRRRRLGYGLWAGAGLTALYGAWVALSAPSAGRETASLLLSLIARVAAAAVALLVGGRVREATGRRSWSFLAVGFALWAVAEGVRVGGWIEDGPPALPSIGDLLRLAGYFSAIAALGAYPVAPPERFGRLRGLLDVSILTVAVVALSWMQFIRPVVQVGLGSLIQVLWVASNPALDLVLVGLVLRLLLLESRPGGRGLLRLLGLALVVQATGDLVGGYLALEGDLRPGTFLEALWASGSWLMGAASLRLERDPRGPAHISRAAVRFEPLLSVAFTYAVVGLTILDWRFSGKPDWVGVGAGALLCLLLVTRQGAIAGQVEMRQFAAVVNATTDLAFISRANGEVRLSNPAFRRALGAGDEETRSQRVEDFLLADRTTAEILQEGLEQGWSGEVQFRRPQAEPIPVSLSLIPVQDERRPQPLLVGTAHDLTRVKDREQRLQSALEQVAAGRAALEALNAELERKVDDRTRELAQTVADLARLNEELKELDRLKSEFVALVSHELRAPLTNIRTGVELVLDGQGRSAESDRTALQLVQAETERLGRFVETILDLSALDAGRFALQPAPCDLAEVAQGAIARFPEGNAGRMRMSIPAGIGVMADSQALTSVLYHLLDNACKYAPEGEILLEAWPEDHEVGVAVVDAGPGIPPEERERVFDMFHRLDARDARDVYGHGLGLYMARRLVQAQGGRIRMEAAPGGGARAAFWLPAASVTGRELRESSPGPGEAP